MIKHSDIIWEKLQKDEKYQAAMKASDPAVQAQIELIMKTFIGNMSESFDTLAKLLEDKKIKKQLHEKMRKGKK